MSFARRTIEEPAALGGRRLQRARIEYAVLDGRLEGEVTLPDGTTCTFADVAELEAALSVSRGRLVLVDARSLDADEEQAGLAALTETERAIAQAAAGGASNREIADSLYYSVKSVEAYLTRIYRRLSVDGRHGLRGVLGSGHVDDLEVGAEHAQGVAGGSPAPVPAPRGRVAVELLLA